MAKWESVEIISALWTRHLNSSLTQSLLLTNCSLFLLEEKSSQNSLLPKNVRSDSWQRCGRCTDDDHSLKILSHVSPVWDFHCTGNFPMVHGNSTFENSRCYKYILMTSWLWYQPRMSLPNNFEKSCADSQSQVFESRRKNVNLELQLSSSWAIDASGIHPTENKVQAIHDPKSKQELQTFLGLLNFCYPGFSEPTAVVI